MLSVIATDAGGVCASDSHVGLGVSGSEVSLWGV